MGVPARPGKPGRGGRLARTSKADDVAARGVAAASALAQSLLCPGVVSRLHLAWLLALLSSCSLNPKGELPGEAEGSGTSTSEDDGFFPDFGAPSGSEPPLSTDDRGGFTDDIGPDDLDATDAVESPDVDFPPDSPTAEPGDGLTDSATDEGAEDDDLNAGPERGDGGAALSDGGRTEESARMGDAMPPVLDAGAEEGGVTDPSDAGL